jgi:acetyl-CoA carboxylase carboxyl transferase subunit alpha
MKVQPLEFERPLLELEKQIEQLTNEAARNSLDLGPTIADLRSRLDEQRRQIYQDLSAWQRVQIARHVQRPFTLDYITACFEDFTELHGDRHVGDDHSMPGGLARFRDRNCVVLGHQKGRDTKENLLRNFGSAHPEGYRKALRLMRMGEKFGLPIIAFIDTPGAFPGIGAEERNIAEAIAFNLREMMLLRVPIIAIVIGEGGSGGALGIGVADKVLMLENAYYSVISPEGCAAILWKHRKHAPEAAEAMKLTAGDLHGLGLVDGVIPEPEGGAHHDPQATARSVGDAIAAAIAELSALSTDDLLARRYEKFRRFGAFSEAG